MEMSQGDSLYGYLKETKMSFFFFSKNGEQEGKTGRLYQWEWGEDIRKGHRR
jgi:hypothetical protein